MVRTFVQKLKNVCQSQRSNLIVALITVFTASTSLGLRSLGGWESLELLGLDYLLIFRPTESPDQRVVIVEVSDSDIQRAKKLGLATKWPWSDRIFADLISKITAAKPIVIGFDKFLDIPSQEGRAELIEAIAQTGTKSDPKRNTKPKTRIPIINATLFTPDNRPGGVELAPDLAKYSSSGFANMVTEAGGMVHRSLLGSHNDVSFGYAIAQEYLAKKYGQVMELDPDTKQLRFKQLVIPRFSANAGGYANEDADGYQVLINYRNSSSAFQHISAVDLLLDQPGVNALLRDRLVLIGITAETVKDRLPTPNSLITNNTTPGIEIHAHIISQLLAAIADGRPLILVWADHWESVWIVAWTVLGGILAAALRRVLFNLVAVGVAIAGLLIISYSAFISICLWLPFFPAIAGLVVANVSVFAYQFSLEQADRQLLMGMFSRHVSKELVDVLWQSREQFLQKGRIEGQEVYVTVLFTDMRNFSTAAEAQQPGETLNWLNSYLGAIAEEVISQHGMVDKYIGDAVMAVFGVPICHLNEAERCQDAQNAVRAALNMAKKLAIMSDRWQEQGLPPVVTGIGINSGMVIAGSLGSCERLEYSVIGDAVNVAARLESFNKEVDGGIHHILISEDTHQRLEQKFEVEFVGDFELKGRKASTPVYRVLGEKLAILES
jgi:adenylate cyclase